MAETSGPVHLFTILRTDHHNFTRTFAQIMSAPEDRRPELFGLLHGQLTQHSELEEKCFYSQLQRFPQLRDLAVLAQGDHDKMRDILNRMDEMDPTSDEFLILCNQLEQAKDDHITLEEREIFVRTIEVLREDDLRRMGEEMAAEKLKVPEPRPLIRGGITSPEANA